MHDNRPLIWILDSVRTPLADFMDAFYWAEAIYVGPGDPMPDWDASPDAVFFSAEITGGADGELFTYLYRSAGGIPLLAIAKMRSLAQAVSLFRAGAADYLSLPLYEDDARERFLAALDRRERQSMPTVMVELESVDGDEGEVSLSLSPSLETNAFEGDILAELATSEMPGPAAARAGQTDTETREAAPEAAFSAPGAEEAAGDGEEPVAVDGLPIPSLWEELPCGLLVFDSDGNLVFTNAMAMDLFGQETLAGLQDALDGDRAGFAAYSTNGKPLPGNQWPHIVAAKSRTARSAVISIEKPDKRRLWLRIDCLPHLFSGKMTRLSMTVVNLTGELPPLAVGDDRAPVPGKREKARQRGGRRR